MTAIKIGQMNHLTIVREADIGYFLAHEDDHSVVALLPRRSEPENLAIDDELEVFVYSDSEERFLATTKEPIAMVGEVAFLKVVEINQIGAFLDWGLPKDLLLPFGEQKERIFEGRFCSVYLHKDKYAERVVASQRLNRHIGITPANYQPGEKVNIDVITRTDLGFKVIVNHSHWGLLYENQVFTHLERGVRTNAWVSRVVADNKVDVSLSPPRKQRFSEASEQIMDELGAVGGFLRLHDKSTPTAIRDRLGMSKKNFKAAIGKLYKDRKIMIEPDGIRLANTSKKQA
jgi:predicted RNA-binding protein (virulence factor B family)